MLIYGSSTYMRRSFVMNCFFMFQENFHSFNKLFINGMEERIFCFNLNRIHQFLSHSRLWRLFYVKKYNRTNCCSCLGNKCSLRKCKSQQKHSLIDAQWAKKMEKQYRQPSHCAVSLCAFHTLCDFWKIYLAKYKTSLCAGKNSTK